MRNAERVLYIIILAIVVACAGSPPKKEYKVTDYVLDHNPCIYYLSGDKYERVCPGETGYPKSVVVMSGKDHKNEINYQNKLIKACKEWR